MWWGIYYCVTGLLLSLSWNNLVIDQDLMKLRARRLIIVNALWPAKWKELLEIWYMEVSNCSNSSELWCRIDLYSGVDKYRTDISHIPLVLLTNTISDWTLLACKVVTQYVCCMLNTGQYCKRVFYNNRLLLMQKMQTECTFLCVCIVCMHLCNSLFILYFVQIMFNRLVSFCCINVHL